MTPDQLAVLQPIRATPQRSPYLPTALPLGAAIVEAPRTPPPG
jgi:hypothetical protein